MSQPGDLLSQAGGFLRAAPEPGWDAIAARVIAAVRATPRPGGWPLIADGPIIPAKDISTSRENVIRSTLAVTLRQLYLCAPTAIEFGIDDGALRAGAHRSDRQLRHRTRRLADRIRATTADTVTELLGVTATIRGPIDITITDVVTGDPLHT